MHCLAKFTVSFRIVIYLMNLKEYCCDDDDLCICILGPFIFETNWDKLLELLEFILDGEG